MKNTHIIDRVKPQKIRHGELREKQLETARGWKAKKAGEKYPAEEAKPGEPLQSRLHAGIHQLGVCICRCRWHYHFPPDSLNNLILAHHFHPRTHQVCEDTSTSQGQNLFQMLCVCVNALNGPGKQLHWVSGDWFRFQSSDPSAPQLCLPIVEPVVAAGAPGHTCGRWGSGR